MGGEEGTRAPLASKWEGRKAPGMGTQLPSGFCPHAQPVSVVLGVSAGTRPPRCSREPGAVM